MIRNVPRSIEMPLWNYSGGLKIPLIWAPPRQDLAIFYFLLIIICKFRFRLFRKLIIFAPWSDMIPTPDSANFRYCVAHLPFRLSNFHRRSLFINYNPPIIFLFVIIFLSCLTNAINSRFLIEFLSQGHSFIGIDYCFFLFQNWYQIFQFRNTFSFIIRIFFPQVANYCSLFVLADFCDAYVSL